MKLAMIITAAVVLAGAKAPTPTATPTMSPDDKQYKAVIEVPAQTKDQLFSKCLAWMGETFKSSKAVIEVQDKEAGRLIGHPVTTITVALPMGSSHAPLDSRYTLLIEMRDGAVRFTAKDFDGWYGGWHGREYVQDKPAYMAKLRVNMEVLRDNLKAYLTKPDEKW